MAKDTTFAHAEHGGKNLVLIDEARDDVDQGNGEIDYGGLKSTTIFMALIYPFSPFLGYHVFLAISIGCESMGNQKER